ncbi:MAG: TetR/AcrR family transcriptional regulator [Acidobacteriota bacterium]
MVNKENKREKILMAALEVFTKKGFHASSMAMVARKAKISVGAIYNYFKNEDDLIRQIFLEIKKDMISVLSENINQDMECEEKFITFWITIFKYLIKNPSKFRYLEQYFNSPYGIRERKECLVEKGEGPSLLIEIFKEGINKKIIQNLPLEILTAITMGPMVSLARDSSLGFSNLDENLIKKCAECCFRGIANK